MNTHLYNYVEKNLNELVDDDDAWPTNAIRDSGNSLLQDTYDLFVNVGEYEKVPIVSPKGCTWTRFLKQRYLQWLIDIDSELLLKIFTEHDVMELLRLEEDL